MKILVIEDNLVVSHSIGSVLRSLGDEVLVSQDAESGLALIESDPEIKLIVLDWMLPGMDGLEVCRRVKANGKPESHHILLLSGKNEKQDVVEGFKAGADDYMIKPFDPEELRARIRVGQRLIGLQERLNARVEELESALKLVTELEELLPICAYCKRIRDDRNYWQQMEAYISHRSNVKFSHGICPECKANLVSEIKRKQAAG